MKTKDKNRENIFMGGAVMRTSDDVRRVKLFADGLVSWLGQPVLHGFRFDQVFWALACKFARTVAQPGAVDFRHIELAEKFADS